MSSKTLVSLENIIIVIIFLGIFGASYVMGVDPGGVLLRIIIGVTSSIILAWYIKTQNREKTPQKQPFQKTPPRRMPKVVKEFSEQKSPEARRTLPPAPKIPQHIPFTPVSKQSVSEEQQKLFSTIQFQVQKVIFDQDEAGVIVRIIPYSGLMKEIIARFTQHQIIMSSHLQRQDLPRINIELKIDEEPRIPDYADPWKNITLMGDEKSINHIKHQRCEIAHCMAAVGKTAVKIESSSKGEIQVQLICKEDPEAVRHAYTLLKEVQLYLEGSPDLVSLDDIWRKPSE